jgi:UDP-GlcNAc:undecaprenyl-phosphate GlcNAc-1-phosphate transferase
VLVAWTLLLFYHNAVAQNFRQALPTLALMLVPGVVVLLLGVYDDILGASPWQKLLVQTLAAGLAYWGGFKITSVSHLLGPGSHNALLTFGLTWLWIVGVTNAFNLIDGMDGLAGGVAFFVTIPVFLMALLGNAVLACVLAITFAGALVGFLKYNFAPAKIYLGDTGSLFLGFMLATLAIHTSQKTTTLLAVVIPLAAFGLPLLDTLLAVVRRFVQGKPIFSADLEHIHHQLLRRGFSKRGVVLALYGLAALFSLGSLLMIGTGHAAALIVVLVGVSAWFVNRQLRYDELAELNVYVSRAFRSQRRVLANQILLRKAAQELAAAETLEGLWERMTATLASVDFDSARCRLSPTPNLPVSRQLLWRRDGIRDDDPVWSVTIPLGYDGVGFGELEISRFVGKPRLLFQFSSLLDTLVPAFQDRLAQLIEEPEEAAEWRASASAA